ncbi:hypothetical protein PV327_006034 [Microctonus hyperodae]|uniref:Uncharacterized protein n=1 Tax=Microctonus hyperodae TaxID=165561 RepID=A0AA39G2M4_MICHY|nr:hypothetical protein PV327_006034 [Microctonus hyperodae]
MRVETLATTLYAALKQQQSHDLLWEREREREVKKTRSNDQSVGTDVGIDQHDHLINTDYRSNGKHSPIGQHAVTLAPMTQQKQPIISQQSQQPCSATPGTQTSPQQSPQAPHRASPPNPNQGLLSGGPPSGPPSQNSSQMMLSPVSGLHHQMQQLLQQHILTPTQLQSFLESTLYGGSFISRQES